MSEKLTYRVVKKQIGDGGRKGKTFPWIKITISMYIDAGQCNLVSDKKIGLNVHCLVTFIGTAGSFNI